MLHGVIIKKIVNHPDDRGYFREILRDDDSLLDRFGQTSVTLTRPGVIKAFHWHKYQDDIWYIAQGRALVGLYDMRKDSLTFGKTQSILAEGDNPMLIKIPIGVAHGYKVLGDQPVLLFYHTTKSYNPKDPDEGRIDFDDPSISFHWNEYL
ncbi:dTDP-4-dehydrorhamnose 3,5-epimerase family protein [Candidatus Peregrinibacteria bacterium]|nr:dTDP-4-dehydrorhamnose 3,5-epimerase family protein [Candidatus Peregrinibacteria bacterium]